MKPFHSLSITAANNTSHKLFVLSDSYNILYISQFVTYYSSLLQDHELALFGTD